MAKNTDFINKFCQLFESCLDNFIQLELAIIKQVEKSADKLNPENTESSLCLNRRIPDNATQG